MKKHAAVAITIGMAFAATPSAHADDPWIAMAISDSTGQYTYGGTSKSDAEQTVMSACPKTISDCRLLASGQGGCVAIAMNAANTKYYGGWGPTRDDAEAAALATAHGGTVQKDHTTLPGRSWQLMTKSVVVGLRS